MHFPIVLPVFTVLPQRSTKVDDGVDVRLSCAATGTPPPTIRWETVNVSLSNFTVDSNNDLVITSIVEANSGMYVCVAENDAGIITVYSEVTSSLAS